MNLLFETGVMEQSSFAVMRAIFIAVALAVIVVQGFLAGLIVYVLCEMLNYILFGKAAGAENK